MQIVSDNQYIPAKDCVVTFGKFDGIHKGHKHLISIARDYADKNGLLIVFFTVITEHKNNNDKVITTLEEKRKICEELGIDVLFEYKLSDAAMHMKPEDFLKKIIKEKLHAKVVVAGSDWRFGRDRGGDTSLLKAYQKIYNYEAVVIDKDTYNGRDISSTYIREQILLGHMETVNLLLGYPYCIFGEVKKGRQIGRTINFPTINLIPDKDKLLPPFGVYASKIEIDRKIFFGITNIGIKPTVKEDSEITIETNIFDFEGDLYGKKVCVCLCHFQRPEMKFENLEKLKSSIENDVNFARNFFMI